MRYNIMAEAHDGVFSVDEECLGQVEANSAETALYYFAEVDKRITWNDWWKRYGVGVDGNRRIFVVEVK